MRKLLLIARANLRKAKGQTVAIVVLILLAATLLNLWLMLSLDYHANFDRYHDQLNAEHVTLAVDGQVDAVQDYLTQTLTNDTKVQDYRLDACLYMVGTFPYNGGTMNASLIFMEKSAALNRTIGKVEIVKEDSDLTSGIYLPMLYQSDTVAVGKAIEIAVGSHPMTYTVCGFFNSVMLGSNNCVLTQMLLTPDKYAELATTGYADPTTLCAIRLNNPADNLNYEADLRASVGKQFPNIIMLSNCYDIVTQSRYIAQSICSVIMSVMAFLILLIALVVIVSNIINYLQVNLKNLGALKALGYSARQLVGSLLCQFLGITLVTAVVGTALAYALFPAVNAMMIAQTGIPYAVHFLPLPIIISLLVLCGAVALAVWLAARRVKKIEPIVALRAGVATHNFQRNHVPLSKTKAPLNLALALKTTLAGVKHNLTVGITVLVLSLVLVFSGLMTQNVIADIAPFLDLIVDETADSAISVNVAAEDNFLTVVRNDQRTEKAYLYTSVNVAHKGGAELMATISDDFAKVNNQSVVYAGRFPRYANEIAVAGKYAQEKGLAVGNEIAITANGKTETYLISGFTQITNNLGRDCLFTRAGYERLGALTNVTYYLNLTDGADIDAYNADIKEQLPDQVNTTINVATTIDGAAGVYVSLMTIIVIAILVLSVIIIVFVLYLLVRTMLNNKKRDYGIQKALGFTTKQLILQTALSFMPAVILSTVVGIVVSCFAINPLLSLFLSSIGIVKCTFAVPYAFVTIAGLGLILLSFGIACLLSLKIKKIAPRNLLVGE